MRNSFPQQIEITAFIVLTALVTLKSFYFKETLMPKGYLVANIRVTDQERFQQFSGMAGQLSKNMVAKFWREALWLTGLRVTSVALL